MERKGKLTRKVMRSLDERTQTHGNLRFSVITNAFLNLKKVNVFEHLVKWGHVSVYERYHQGVARQDKHLLSYDRERHLWSPKYLKFPCVCVLSFGDLVTFLMSFPFLSIYWVIHTSVLSFPHRKERSDTYLTHLWKLLQNIEKLEN